MDSIILEAIVTPDHRLIVDLPATIPSGPVKILIQSLEDQQILTREAARAKLLAANRLSTIRHAPVDAAPLSDAERQRLAQLFADEARSMLDLINEDRQEG